MSQNIPDVQIPFAQNLLEINKIIVVDWYMFAFTAITNYGLMKKQNLKFNPVPTYTLLNSLLSHLKRIGVQPNDIIILAKDKKSWRKKYSTEYKKDREEKRSSFEKDTGITFGEEFIKINSLFNTLDITYPFYCIEEEGLEADDIAALICKEFIDKEIILLSFDSDWEQLWFYSNVKIYSPHSARTKKNNNWKIKPKEFDYKVFLNNELNKKTHNNLGTELATADALELKMMLINLVDLPEFIISYKDSILKKLDKQKEFIPEIIKSPSLNKKIQTLFEQDKILSYDKVFKKQRKVK